MQIFVEPSLDAWQANSAKGVDGDIDRQGLVGCLVDNARRLGLAKPVANRPMIATGHQAWLWHPGILAKDLAVMAAADRLDTSMFHLVVDQDINPVLRLELPVIQGQRLSVETIELGPSQDNVPSGFQPAIDSQIIRECLSSAKQRLGTTLVVDIAPLMQAFSDLPDCRSLAEQIAVVLDRLRCLSTGGSMPVLFASQLPALPGYRRVLDQMRHDAHGCVTCYNQAVEDSPLSGMMPLQVDPDRVELPLWALIWGRTRQRVFVDLRGQEPVLTLENGKPIGAFASVADQDTPQADKYMLGPRALLMTAVLRRRYCDLFVHGHGGRVYDRVMEDWWSRWLGEKLGPMSVVSADLIQDFDVPVADTAQLQRAVWWAQHVKHNVDRAVEIQLLDRQAVTRKRHLLNHMDDDRDRIRRAAAYSEIQQINRALVLSVPTVMSEAQQRLDHARCGVANQIAVHKRDWCFGLYDHTRLRALATAVAKG